MSKNNKKDKNKLTRLSLDELLWRLKVENGINNTFWNKVKEYLYYRIKTKSFLDDFEIELLNKYVGEMINDGRIAIPIRDDVSKCSTRLIVMSKNTNNPKFVESISKYDIECIGSLTPEDIKLFFETALKYSLACLNRKSLKTILNSLVCDASYLESLRSFIKEEMHLDIYDRKINNMKQKCDVSEVFEIEIPNIVVKSMEELPIIEGKNILTVDKPGTKLFDSAFSIDKKDGVYFFDVYISDVPSFLLKNEEVLKYAYEIGTAMYNSQLPDEYYKVNMIPSEMSKDYLSLNKNEDRNVIVFSFCIDNKGTIQLVNISRNRIVVDHNIDTKAIRGFEFNNPKTDRDVSICKEMCRLVSKNSGSIDYALAHRKRLGDVVAFPSVIVNYHVGRNSNLAIYREDGKYTINSEHKYAHSVTPLRKFASDINLTLYLSQLGLIDCPDKYIHYIEDNMDSIIEHLNQRENLCEYFSTNYREVKKYYKK